MTEVTSTIGATARDYVDPGTWETAKAANLVSTTTLHFGECYNDANFTGHYTIDGSTTDASWHMECYAAPGEEHAGTPATAGVTFLPTSTGNIFTVLDEFFRLGRGCFFDMYSLAADSDECVRVGNSSNSADGLLVEQAIFRDTTTVTNTDALYGGNWDVGSASDPVRVRNCTIFGFQRCGIFAQAWNTSGLSDHYWDVVNCTIMDCAYDIGWNMRHANVSVTWRIVNCILGDSSTADYARVPGGAVLGTLTTTGSTNNWDERNQVPGADAGNPMVITTSTTPGAGTWSIHNTLYSNLILIDQAENAVLDTGVGPDTNALVDDFDIVSVARSGTTTDPGAWQVTTVAAPGDITPILSRQRTHQTHIRM